jgi:hypothetical protein
MDESRRRDFCGGRPDRRAGVVSLVAWAVESPGVSLVAINLRRWLVMPHRSGECGAAILPITLRDVGVGA